MRVNDRHLSFYYEPDNDMGEIKIDPAKTALLIVDMQNGSLVRPENDDKEHAERWEPFYKKIDEVVLPCNKRILEAFREKKMNIVFAKVISHKNDGSDRSLDHMVPLPCAMYGRFIRNSKAVRRESTDAILLPFPQLSVEKCSPIGFMRSKNCTRRNRTMIWIGTSYQKN